MVSTDHLLRLLALVIGVLVIAPLTSDNSGAIAPSITELNIHDGDWFTDPNITLTGSTNTTSINWTLGYNEFKKGNMTDVRMVGPRIIFSPIQHQLSLIENGSLDMDVWEVLSDGEIYVQDNALLLLRRSDGMGPLIATIENPFPSGSNWNATINMAFSELEGWCEDIGIGISNNVTDHMTSHLSVYANTSLPDSEHPYDIRSFGDFITNWWATYPQNYGTISLDYSYIDDNYRVFMETKAIHSFESAEKPNMIWLGSLDLVPSLLNSNALWILGMNLWTNSGDWVSEVYEMDGPITISTIRPEWVQYGSSEGSVDLMVRSSKDNVSWSEWSIMGGGSLPLSSDGRFLQMRARMSFIPGYNETISVRLEEITIEYYYPVDSVKVRLNDGSWIKDIGIDVWETNLTLAEDGNLVEVRVEDTRGHTNTTFMNLTLDTTPPTGTIGFVGSRTHYNTEDLVLDLNATDRYGIKKVVLASLPDLSDRVLLDYEDRINWTIPGGSGEYTIYARFVDTHGLRSNVVNSTIIYDPHHPSGSLAIANGADHTDDRTVSIDLTYFDKYGIASIELSNDPTIGVGRLIEEGTTRVTDWELAAGASGERRVYLRVKDLAGNEIIVNDMIDLYVPEPLGDVEIKGGEAYTAKTLVDLSIRPPEGLPARRMQISNDPSFEEGIWEEVRPLRYWTLPDSDGEQRVYVRFEDGRGYRTLAISDSIILDTTPPTVTLEIDGGAEYTTDRIVRLDISYEDSLPSHEMWISSTDDRRSVESRGYTSFLEWQLMDGEGIKTVHVWVSDSLGNVGHIFGSIHLATVPPYVHTTVVGGDNCNAIEFIEVEVMALDQYGLPIEIQMVFDDDSFVPTGWVAVDGPHHVGIPQLTPDGVYYIYTRARNELGLVSDSMETMVVLDRVAPVFDVVRPTEGSTHIIAEPFIDLELVVHDEFEIATLEYRLNGGEWAPLDPLAPQIRIELDAFGDQRIEVRAVDEAGNNVVKETNFEVKDSMMLNLTYAMLVIVPIVVLIGSYVLFIRRRRNHKES